MRKKTVLKKLALFGLSCFFLYSQGWAQRTGYSKSELMRRRASLMEQVQDGLIILFGNAMEVPGAHTRQDNDFYYFTGVEDLGAITIIIPKIKQAVLFLPAQTDREAMYVGDNLLRDPEGKEKSGFDAIYPLSFFDQYLGRMAMSFGPRFHVRLYPRDSIDLARYETLLYIGRKNRSHYNDQLSIDNYRLMKLKDRFPFAEFHDITMLIDEMRVIKSPEEIAILRRIGKSSADGVKRAILATRPGVYEYELEAEAMYAVLKEGARGFAYPPIVGSGPNSCVLHYAKNSRRIEDGDLVLMDFGGELDYMCMDISRTWPAGGTFTDEQKEVYITALEIQKACIEAYRPGVTNADVQKHVAEVMKRKGIDPRGEKGGLGHYVGMATHDAGPYGGALREGMVFAIEPGFYYPEKNLGVRIEDTVLITKNGCEVLTKDVPKELAEIEKMMAERK